MLENRRVLRDGGDGMADKVGVWRGGPRGALSHIFFWLRCSSIAWRAYFENTYSVGVWGETVLLLHKEKMISTHWPLIVMVVGGDRNADGREGRISGGGSLSRGERISSGNCEKYDIWVVQYGLSTGQKNITFVVEVQFQIRDQCWIPQPKLHGWMYLIFL